MGLSNSSLRTRLIVSYIAIIACLGIGFLLLTEYLITDQLIRKTLTASENSIREMAENSVKLSEELLTGYGEKMVILHADRAASRLSLMLRDQKRPFDTTALGRDKNFRSVATESIIADDRPAGYIDVMDNTGNAIWHPNPEVEGRNYSKFKNEFPDTWKLLQRSFKNDNITGYITFFDKNSNKHRKKFIALKHVPGTNYIVCASVYIGDYFDPEVKQIRDIEEAQVTKTESAIKQASVSALNTSRFAGFIGIILLCLAGTLIGAISARSISGPLDKLVTGVERIGSGDFSANVDEKGPAEITRLASSFNMLGGKLLEYVNVIKNETAERQRVESELSVARQIQLSLVPRTFPPFPDIKEISLSAKLLPAREVGGDFYDFFFIDDDNLVLIIGDVSGKSFPAAFFMAVVRTLLRSIFAHLQNPAEALAAANNILCRDNDACMFVTIFLGCYNLKSGIFTYANAGHLNAYILKHDGTLDSFGILGDFALGIMTIPSFQTGTRAIEPGDRLILYTDGISEATAPNGELFGDMRFEAFLSSHASMETPELCDAIVDTINPHCAFEVSVTFT